MSLGKYRSSRYWIWNALKSFAIHLVFCCLWYIIYVQVYPFGPFYLEDIDKQSHVYSRNSSSDVTVNLVIHCNGCTLTSTFRIYLGYHTASQVVIGSSIGIAYGWLWYKLVDYVHSTKWIIDRILNSEISKKLYLKDMYFIQNVAKWEYEQWLTAYKKTL